MMRLTFATLASLSALSLTLCACSGPSATEVARHVAGTVKSPAGHQISDIEAVSHYKDYGSGEPEIVYTSLESDGSFDLLVYGGSSVRIAFFELGKSVGVLRFPRKNGQTTSLLQITSPPDVLDKTPQNGPGSSDGQDVKIVYEDVGIYLGTLSSPNGDNLYQAENNPLGQIDADGDGVADLADDDADGDGVADKDDNDFDNDGRDDAAEDNDLDNDGMPDDQGI